MDINQKISEIAADRSFVDIGGLWGTENERVIPSRLNIDTRPIASSD
jgi:hypothetical protein